MYQQFCAGLVFLNFLEGFNPFIIFFTTPSSFCSFLSTPFPQPSLSFLSLSLTSLSLLALAHFIFSLCAHVNMVFVLHTISTNKNRFYLLYFTTYIPMLILAVINKFIKSGTEVEHRNQYMHRNQSNRTIYCEYLLLNQVLIHSLEHGEIPKT